MSVPKVDGPPDPSNHDATDDGGDLRRQLGELAELPKPASEASLALARELADDMRRERGGQ